MISVLIPKISLPGARQMSGALPGLSTMGAVQLMMQAEAGLLSLLLLSLSLRGLHALLMMVQLVGRAWLRCQARWHQNLCVKQE